MKTYPKRGSLHATINKVDYNRYKVVLTYTITLLVGTTETHDVIHSQVRMRPRKYYPEKLRQSSVHTRCTRTLAHAG